MMLEQAGAALQQRTLPVRHPLWQTDLTYARDWLGDVRSPGRSVARVSQGVEGH
jgi:hypothetical protein